MPAKIKRLVALFWVTPVTFFPIAPEMLVVPLPLPLLVKAPALFKEHDRPRARIAKAQTALAGDGAPDAQVEG